MRTLLSEEAEITMSMTAVYDTYDIHVAWCCCS